MKKLLSLLILVCMEQALHAQYVYTIKADSVKITNSCDTAELIIENHTQNVCGFLFNKGRGRTEFRRAMMKMNDSIYTFGCDTLRLSVAWLQGGNTFGTTGYFGTRDNNHIDFYTNAIKRGRYTNTGNFLIGGDADYGYKAAVYGTTYSQFYTNSTTPLGGGGSGALRLRWGGGEGTYVDFYNQGNTNRRGYIGTASDARPLVITDSVGFTWGYTPCVAFGLESGAPLQSRFTIASERSSGWDAFTIIGTEGVYNKDMVVKANGNVLLGGTSGVDNGRKLQVYGTSWFGNIANFSHPTYATGISAGIGWVDNNMFRIWGGPNNESLTFGAANSITSNVLFTAPTFYASNTSSFGANYYVPASGGFYSTINSPANDNTVYHTFTTSMPQAASGAGNPVVVEINKLVNRGATVEHPEHDGVETGLRIKFTVTGYANKLRALETVNGDVRLHTSSGRTSIGLDGSSTITSRLDVSGEEGYNQLRLRKKYTPTSSSDANGAEGDVSWDDNYIYIKTSSGWKRTTLSSF